MGKLDGKVAFVTGAAQARAAVARSVLRRRAPTSWRSTSASRSRR